MLGGRKLRGRRKKSNVSATDKKKTSKETEQDLSLSLALSPPPRSPPPFDHYSTLGDKLRIDKNSCQNQCQQSPSSSISPWQINKTRGWLEIPLFSQTHCVLPLSGMDFSCLAPSAVGRWYQINCMKPPHSFAEPSVLLISGCSSGELWL